MSLVSLYTWKHLKISLFLKDDFSKKNTILSLHLPNRHTHTHAYTHITLNVSNPLKVNCTCPFSFAKTVMMRMMMMNCFCGMVDRRKAFSLISNRDHCQRSSSSRISDTPRAGFEPAQNLSSGFVEWSCAVEITTKLRHHYTTASVKQRFSQEASS